LNESSKNEDSLEVKDFEEVEEENPEAEGRGFGR